MKVSRQMLFSVVLVFVSSLSIHVSASIQHKFALKQLIRKRLIPDFQFDLLVLPHKTQFAVAILLPDSDWWKFNYYPSEHYGNYKGPVISSLSPPIQETKLYGNYLAARPRKVWKNGQPDILHSETQILPHLGNLYAASADLYGKNPGALVIYSWIVPCKTCTKAILAELDKEPFKSIKTKVVAYTTCGKKVKNCDVSYTQLMFKKADVDLLRVETLDKEFIQNFIAQLILK